MNKKKAATHKLTLWLQPLNSRRGGRIRTYGPLLPKQVR